MSKNTHMNLPWSEVPILLALMRGKSLMAAASELKVDRTTVARRLERLEASLGLQLFERLNGKLEPTEHGRRLFSIAERAEQELSDIQSDDEDKDLVLKHLSSLTSPFWSPLYFAMTEATGNGSRLLSTKTRFVCEMYPLT